MRKFKIGDIVKGTDESLISQDILFVVASRGKYDRLANAMFYRLDILGKEKTDIKYGYALHNAEALELANPLLSWLESAK